MGKISFNARRTFLFIVVYLFTCAPFSAFSDVQTFNTILFQPAPGPSSYAMLRDSQSLYQYQFQVAEIFSYAYRPLDLRLGGRRFKGIVNDILVANTSISFGIIDWLEIGLNAPVVLLDRFEAPTSSGGLQNKFHFSDLRFEVKFSPLKSCINPVGLAVIPFIIAPTGKNDYYIGDSGISGGLVTALDIEMSREAKFTLNLGYKGGKKVKIQNIEYQHNLLFGAGFSFAIKSLTLFLETNGQTAFNKFFTSKAVTPVEVMGGIKFKIGETGLSLSASAGSCAICGAKGSLVNASLGVTYKFMNEKYRKLARGDYLSCVNKYASEYELEEILKLKMKCPPDESQYKQGVNDDACPKLYELQETADLVNTCPTNPNDFNPKLHDAACPKVYELQVYYDQEQIYAIYELSNAEMSLRCPANANEYNPFLHDASCPKYYSLLDTINLAKDCPADQSKYNSKIHDPSCMKYYQLKGEYSETEWAYITKLAKKDTDNDGINDYLDRCPRYPEDKNGFADEDGCPEGGIIAVTGGEIHTYKPVTFAFNSDELDYSDKQIIDQVIGLVNKTPWIKTVRVGGHADERGTDDANELISKKRAQSVIRYMRAKGLRTSVRLIPIAYGSNRPIAKNAMTEEEREINRRVVFTAVRDAYGPDSMRR